jgi:hypothetical protein
MSSQWRVSQARWLLEQSAEHHNYARRPEYAYVVMSILDANYAALCLLNEFKGCTADDGVRFEDWYGSKVKTRQNDEADILGFFFRKNEGIRSKAVHKSTPLLCWSGERSGEEALADATPDSRYDEVERQFQEAVMLGLSEDPPAWAARFSAPVHTLLVELTDEVSRLANEADTKFLCARYPRLYAVE